MSGGGKSISIHALCEEGDCGLRLNIGSLFDFYPRPLRGGRRDAQGAVDLDAVFLSTPSARRATFCFFGACIILVISIHALCEEGDTMNKPMFTKSFTISIHALCEEGDLCRAGHTA